MTNRGGQSFLVGLIGHGIRRSLSPALHERAAARLGIKYVYRLIDLQELRMDVSSLPRLLDSAEEMGFRGLNITHPCKQAVLAYLHELSDSAGNIGAVNTIVFQNGRRIGHNTDAYGFAQAFRAEADGARTDHVVQLGAGGAGSAVAHAILDIGARRVLLSDSDRQKADRLAERLRNRFGADRVAVVEDLAAAMDSADGLIHATPMGMASHPGMAVRPELLKPSHWVAEIVYFPLETELLRVARDKGCRTIDGSGMAIYQAAAAFRLFTEAEPEIDEMRRDFDDLVSAARIAPTDDLYAAQ